MVVLIVAVPDALGVNVQVTAAVEPAGMETVAGENTPASVEAGVTVIADVFAVPVPGVIVRVTGLPMTTDEALRADV
ncbi:hypothetical protein AA21952_2667 [Acetobacter oeni LMG 21952]|nr:hypothetical protein AA21952_2667 [Acetobacter oeni LMG 21952]